MSTQKQIENDSKQIDAKQHKLHKALPQCIAVSIKNVLLLGYGMTLGFPTILIPALQGGQPNEPLILNLEQISWISSINLICVPLGCLFSGIISQPIGRKKSMQLVNLPFIAAWLIFHYSNRVEHLYTALCLTGLSGGLLEAPVLTYVAEITQPHLRGMLSATSSMTIIFGVFIQFLMGTFLYWRTLALVNLAIPLLAIVLLFIVPESPTWLIMRNRLTEAQESLAWLRGWTTISNISSEYRDLLHALGHISKNPGLDDSNDSNVASNQPIKKLKGFGERTFIIPYFLVCFAFFLGHFSGMTTLQTFAVQIFQTLKAPIDKYYATLLLGIVELLGSLCCVFAVHYIGKRPLTFISTIGCGLCFITVATYAHLNDIKYMVAASSVNSTNHTNITMISIEESSNSLPTIILIASAFLSHIGIRLLPWVLIGEVFPTSVRSIASGLSGGAGYIFGFAANKAFLTMITNLTLPGTFWLYGILSLTGTALLYFILPETEGRTLSDIELHFSGAKKIPRNAGVYKKKKDSQVMIENGKINHGFTDKTSSEQENMESRL